MTISRHPNILALTQNEANYPSRLLDLFDPPKTLYIYGAINLLQRPMIAIVGSRLASPEGINNAILFSLNRCGMRDGARCHLPTRARRASAIHQGARPVDIRACLWGWPKSIPFPP